MRIYRYISCSFPSFLPGLSVCVLLNAFLLFNASSFVYAGGLDTVKIELLTGLKGKYYEKEGVFKVALPHNDLSITSSGVKITPPMGLSTWAAFKKAGEKVIVTGDIVLLEAQVNPVMSVALENGIDVTALHNHFFWDSPKVMYMHIYGSGDENKIEGAVGKIIDMQKSTRDAVGPAQLDIDPSGSTLDTTKIDEVIGIRGELSDGVYKITVGRETKIMGNPLGAAMGVSTWAAFAGSDGKAVVDGDFAVYEKELRGVLKALLGAGIDIVAIHNHMIGEEPRIVFLHYWGAGPAEGLAKGVKAALDLAKSAGLGPAPMTSPKEIPY